MLGLFQLGFQGRDGSQGIIERRSGLLHIQFRHGAVPKTGFGDLQAFLLDLHILPGNAEPLLQGPNQDIGGRYIGREAHQGIVVVGNRR